MLGGGGGEGEESGKIAGGGGELAMYVCVRILRILFFFRDTLISI